MQESKVTILTSATGQSAARKALKLQCITIAWNVLEGIVAIIASFLSGSVTLLGFGIDSLIEIASGGIVAWGLLHQANGASEEAVTAVEKRTRKAAGILLLLLAAYVAFDSVRQLLGFAARPQESWLGLAITVSALIVMPPLSKAKLKAAHELGSAALKADAVQSICCAWLALTALGGLALNIVFHWWWADSVAACVIVPLLVREGIEAIRDEQCGCHNACSNPEG